MKKRFIYLAAAAAMLAGCSETDELNLAQATKAGDGAVSFSIYTNRAVTRAGQAGVINTDSLKKGNGIGVFAYHTNNSRYDERNSLPNFMYNQQVKWNAAVGNGVWEYSPLKYWPNEFGTNAVSEDIDYVTFFAYAPHVAVNPTTGIPEVDYSKFEPIGFAQYLGYRDTTDFRQKEGYKDSSDAVEALKMLYAKQQQGKNITSISRNADKGDPIVRYVVDTNPQTSVDLLWGVAAKDNAFKGLAGPDEVTEGNCYIDLSKQIGTADSIRWNFRHALAKLNVQIIAAADTATQGLTTYEPKNAEELETATKIYLRSIDFTGFATRGALNLHSEATTVDYKLKPNWTNYDGTDLTAANVTFYDGLKDMKEGYTDNIAPGEKPQGLNPVLIEEPTTTTWADKRQGIPTKDYVNLFAGAKTASDAIFVIPTNERMTITVVYDIMTRDTLLSQKLSDGFTQGSRVQNKISQTLQNLKIEAGKAYTIKLVVGIESVKVTVEVAEWDDKEAEQKVDLPYNPDGSAPAGAIDGKFTINASGTRVYFARGNLQYQASTNKWRFAENQWDFVGGDNASISSSYDGWIDLFGWGTSGHEFASGYGSAYQPWSTSADHLDYGPTDGTSGLTDIYAQGDWGTNMGSDWRTPTKDEWKYVFDTRTTPSGVRYAKATVNGVKGVILLPDNWKTGYYNLTSANTADALYDSNKIISSDWSNCFESNGAVFLPAASRRNANTTYQTGATNGYYWSSSPFNNNPKQATILYFTNGSVIARSNANRALGYSVRLVHLVE